MVLSKDTLRTLGLGISKVGADAKFFSWLAFEHTPESRYSSRMSYIWHNQLLVIYNFIDEKCGFCVELTLTILSVLEAGPVQVHNFCRRFVVVILFAHISFWYIFHDELKFINHLNVSKNRREMNQ